MYLIADICLATKYIQVWNDYWILPEIMELMNMQGAINSKSIAHLPAASRGK